MVTCVEDFGKKSLNARHGESICSSVLFSAYDESIVKFEGLQGTAFLTSHSLVIHGLSDYIPVNLLTFYFYTRALLLSEGSRYIRYSEDLGVDAKRDYVTDRRKLLTVNVPNDAVLFIDGPLIGGNLRLMQ